MRVAAMTRYFCISFNDKYDPIGKKVIFQSQYEYRSFEICPIVKCHGAVLKLELTSFEPTQTNESILYCTI